ncbi:hypothetical protein SOM61_19600 [Massilia sp. CFBP9012]|uniref:hypothetical protein n=1 Tax=Massilia sp. CFBP9012 TaxID=3096531 RepID=UPI002A69D948|nr:hypothetical protein [Massilia sp. CFBP9012]MDY0977176.1 hypothetical protein [Massilia sp. CFBP9012]
MRADAGVMPRRAPGWPLLATLGAHLLLASWWLDATGVRSLPSIVPALREFLVVPVLVPPPAPASSPPVPIPRSTPRSPARAPVEARPITPPAVAPIAESVAETYPDPLAQPSPQDDAAYEEATLAGRARRAAGSVDQDLRKGKLAPLEPTDTPWKRFASAVEGARKDTSRTLTSESYTSPDGTIVYRFRKNGKYYCRTGGGVRPSMFGAEGGGAVLFDKPGGGGIAGLVPCPSGAEFKRD